MLLNFDTLYSKYNMNVKGVLHIGAHIGQEHSIYKKYNINNIIYFEPQPHIFKILKQNVKDEAILINKALGSERKMMTMYIEHNNAGQSSSLLKAEKHLIQYPHIKFTDTIKVQVELLDDIEFDRNDYNFINIDVQGFELEVFKGAEETLNHIDYIVSEVNRGEVYKDCTRVEQLDEYLGKYGFERVETSWDGILWGDGFWRKKENKK
jgi:FkbM family methyltransferase